MTREQMVQASILLRGGELYDLGMLLQDDQSPADMQRWACRDPLAWVLRIAELSRLVHLGRCLPLLAMVAGIVPEELDAELPGQPPHP